MMIALAIVGFFVGAIPFGFILAKRRGVNIQEHGSGNIGATNVTRVLGAKVGAIVLLLDAGKGALAVYLAQRFCGWPSIIALCGGAAILGHCFSPFLRGKGGKGVATSFGVFLMLSPQAAGVAVLVFVVVWRLTRVPALGSLAGSAMLSALFIGRGEIPYTVLACATTTLLVYTHRSNWMKLLTKTD